ncbi:MAG: glycosyltransferase, partial [Pseudomonadota bacterium]
EALAAGKPLIASKVGGIPEIFEDNTDALITPNAASLEAAMQAFLDDPDSLARKMPSKAQLRSRFSVEVMAEAALNAYRAALAQDV